MQRNAFRRLRIAASLLTLALFVLEAAGQNAAQTPAPVTNDAATLVVKGAVKQELHLTAADLKSMTRTKLTAKDHDGTVHEYEGVALQSLLAKAGAPQAGEMRGKNMTLVVIAEAGDGYRAAFSLAELDTDFSGTQVIVADTSDGKPLGAQQGPLRLVVPGDKRQARWVRMLKSIVVQNVSGPQ
jgi:DMSO/TMAO reductase YedYZ molybdopterin-dependent catalytic subunit